MAKKCESNDIFSGMLDLLVNRGVVEDKRIINPKVRLGNFVPNNGMAVVPRIRRKS